MVGGPDEPGEETLMTVMIFAPPPGGDTAAMAKAVLARELGDRLYCSVKRRDAEKAVAEYRPAYLQMTEGTDEWSGCAVTWANGAMLGTSIDPPVPLSGLRAVLRWVQTWKSAEEFDGWMRHVVKSLRPINAMGQLDQELLRSEYGLNEKDVCHV